LNGSGAVVTLPSGHTVPLVALELLWHLEDRGLHVHVDRGGVLVGPQGRLTDHDRRLIVEHKHHLIRLIVDCEAAIQ
jgi:hypothetical protein